MGSSAAGHSCLTNAQYAIRNTSEAKLGEASQLLYAPPTETLAYSRLSEPSPRTYEVESMAWAGIECPARANADRMQVHNKRLKIDLSHVLRAMLVPLWPLPNLARLICPPMRTGLRAGHGSKVANQRANFCRFLGAAVHIRNCPSWLLAQLGTTRLASWLGKSRCFASPRE